METWQDGMAAGRRKGESGGGRGGAKEIGALECQEELTDARRTEAAKRWAATLARGGQAMRSCGGQLTPSQECGWGQ